MVYNRKFFTYLTAVLLASGLSAVENGNREGQAALAKKHVRNTPNVTGEDAGNSSPTIQSTGDQGDNPSVVLESIDERSAIRYDGETYEDAVLRHENLRTRNHPDNLVSPYATRATVKNSQVPVDQADLSKVPVWSDSEITRHFEYSRDLRFQTVSSNPNFLRRLSWLYPDDGCYARAELVCSKSAEAGLERPYKLFSFGSLKVETTNHPQGYVQWWYHVVPVVKSATTNECLVLDAAINPYKPLPWKEWLLTQVSSLSEIKVTVADTNAYSPNSPVTGGSNMSAQALSDQKSSHLPAEWDRQVALKRDPNKVLGDAPPWLSNNLYIKTQPSSMSVMEKTSVKFSVAAAGGTTPYHYQWYKNGNPINGANSATYMFTAQVIDSGSTFTADVTDSSSPAETVTSNSATLTVFEDDGTTYNEMEGNDSLSAANTVPDGVTKIVGYLSTNADLDYFRVNVSAGVTLKIDMTGPAKDYDLFLFDSSGTQVAKSTGSSAKESISYANTGSAAAYIIQVKGYNGAFSNDTPYILTLSKGITPVVITVSVNPTTAVIPVNTTKQFTATVSGTSDTSVTWTCTGGSVSNGGFYTAPSTAGTYTVKATSNADTTKSASATVTVTSDNDGSTFNEDEGNDSLSAANSVPDTTTKIVATIGSSTDKDYFKVLVGAGKTLTVNMTGPTGKDYDLYLYNSSGTQLAKSTSSTATQSVTYQNTEADAVYYFIHVKGYNGAYTATTPYYLALSR